MSVEIPKKRVPNDKILPQQNSVVDKLAKSQTIEFKIPSNLKFAGDEIR